jgi:L,D-peptidoglycan transpeptidase YkuD (ErfK/YbiS/YcfS/YnhG family)
MEAVVHPDGRLLFGGRQMRAALGRGGVRLHKEEGDGATPAALLPLRRVLYRADRVPIPRVVMPREPIAAEDGWCDEPTHADYNRQVRLPHDGHCEELWRSDRLYDIVGVLGWNDSPVERGRGSAIFLHVARPDYAPTEGCVAVALADLQTLLQAGLSAVHVLEK